MAGNKNRLASKTGASFFKFWGCLLSHQNLFLLLILSLSIQVSAQFEKDYTPLKYSYSGSKQTEKNFQKKLSVKYLTNDKGIIHDYNRFLYSLHLMYASQSKEKAFIIEPFVKRYLQSIIDTVAARNKLNQKFEVVCTRFLEVNAYNMGDNKLYVNIGLLRRLENESQLAFLLCHELAHQLLSHVQENFIQLRTKAKDKTIKKELKDINKAKYNKLDRTVQIAKRENYSFGKYSRVKERSADSLAAILLTETDYDAREGISLMRILEKSDTDLTRINYPELFKGDSVSILPEWMAPRKELLDFGRKSIIEFDKDSMRTHPDIPNRIRMIEEQLKSMKSVLNGKQLFVQDKQLFDSIRTMAMLEEVEVFVKFKRYGAMVYYGLAALQKLPDNVYLHKNVAIALNHLQKAVKTHTSQDFVPLESEDLPEAYNQFLRIMDRTTYTDFRKLVYQYLQNNKNRIIQIPEVKTIYENFYK